MKQLVSSGAIAVLMLTGPVAVFPQQATAAATPLAGFTDMVVDAGHSQVFISQGHGSSNLLVLNGDGAVVKTIAGLPGLGDLTLSPDGSAVYGSNEFGDSVAVVDTATYDVTTVPVCDGCLHSLAATPGRVWFSDYFRIGVLDLSDGSVTRDIVTLGATSRLLTHPSRPDELVAHANWGHQEDFLVAYDIDNSGDVVTLTQRARLDWGSARWSGPDAEFTPDGGGLLVSTPYPHRLTVVDADDLTAVAHYQTQDDAGLIAVRHDGMAAVLNPHGGYSVEMFTPGRQLFRKYKFGERLLGMDFIGDRLMTVRGDYSSPQVSVVTPKAETVVSMRVLTKSPVAGGSARIRVDGLLAGRRVVVSVHEPGQPVRVVATRTVQPGVELYLNAPVRRAGFIRATALATPTHDEGYQDRKVTVRAKVTASMKGYQAKRGTTYHYGVHSKAVIQGRVSPDHSDDCVYFRAQFKVRGHWGYDATTKCVSLNDASKARGYLAGAPLLVGIPVRMRVEWTGDKVNTANESKWQYVRFVRSGRTQGRSQCGNARPEAVIAPRTSISTVLARCAREPIGP